MEIKVQKNILQTNEDYANRCRSLIKQNNIYMIDLMGSPGSGKTTLLEQTIKVLGNTLKIGVIEGDLSTDIDRERIRSHGVQAVQVNTGKGCHLNAKMVYDALQELNLKELDIIFLENVGNLVCPAEFNLGQDEKIVVLSTPEGEEKPLKYPIIFRTSKAIVINKIDLLPYVSFDMEKLNNNIENINPGAVKFEVSATKGTGMDGWIDYLKSRIPKSHP
ncbi:MAG: hydrogenase nickel incorporation protein HypB [Armatimonadota bacterium]